MRLLLIIGWLLLAAGACAVEPGLLTRAQDIRALTLEQGRQFLPVQLEAVVTCYHPDWGVLFVHDGTGGICVGVAPERRPTQPYAAGVRLRVEGVAGPGEFLPVVLPSKIEPLGPGTMPSNTRVSAEEMFVPAMDCHPVEVQAVVKGTFFGDESLVLDLQIEGWRVKAVLPQAAGEAQLPWELVERRVRVRGVVGTHFNDQRQMSGRLLFVPGLEAVTLDEEALPQSEAPLVAVDGLLRVHSPLRQRVRVRGVVTHVAVGRGLYLRGEGGSLFVQTAQPVDVLRGHEVEAEGYPAIAAFRPSLSAINVRRTGAQLRMVEALPFEAASTRHSREQCELVTMDAHFLEMTRGRDATLLTCSAEGQVFEAALPNATGETPDLTPGMSLRLTGICEFLTTRPLVIPRNATGFTLQLRDLADIVVLSTPPWWTTSRALWVLGILGAVALAVAAWAITLHFVVRSQSSMIRQQAQQQATLEERQRIARDLHDTLEQELVGVTMLLDSTSMKLNGAHPQAGEPLALARRLLKRVREESRSTIRELRSVTLEQRGLPTALEELLRPLATAGGAAFTVTVCGTAKRLSGMVETHLLRLAQEAVANAARHAQAGRIDLVLTYSAEHIELEVRDDGQGFDPRHAGPATEHFGLSGMRERAEKISGTLGVESAPGGGTCIRVRAPLRATLRPGSNPLST